jgi:hypothetical protein
LKKLFYISALALFFSFFISCKKDKTITSPNAKLSFSQDSVLFDTVFTKIGSTTKLFRVHNRNNGKVNISSIRLARGNASFFRLNVDGVPGKSFSNIEIAAQDSMYIFVEVTIDPNNQTNPFIYRDSILFDLNGGEQHLDLIAFGQNAYYHMPNQKIIFSNSSALYYEVEPCNTTWLSDKPHLIYDYAVVDSACTLTVQAGAKIYLHNSAGIWVYRYGTIKVNGTESNPVTFQGDRLEEEYKDVPGQWDRIWINEGSTANVINYAVIKNGYIGVHAGYSAFDGVGNTVNVGDPKKLTLTNTIIQNCSSMGILGHFYNITGGDNVIVNCGQYLFKVEFGGSYTFYQSTFANYWNQTNNSQTSNARTTPSFYFGNYESSTQLSTLHDSLYFGNCIMDGSLAEEFQFDTIAGTVPAFGHLKFDHCALKTGSLNQNKAPTFSCQINQPMSFVNPSTYNFKLNSNSAAIGQGYSLANGGYFSDINGGSFGSPPSMGAYGP